MTNNQIQTNYSPSVASTGSTAAKTNKPASASNFSNLFHNAVNTVSGQKTTDMDEIFQQAANQYGVPANLLKAVAKAESGFDPNAVSSCGAQGVMQLMPSTAAALGVQDPLDAEQNIMGGAKYLSEMLNRYGGDTQLALAAYNAGSGNVAKYGGVPPFKETQSYISKVMDYAGLSLDAPTTQLAALNGTASSDSLNSANPLGSLSMLSSLFGTPSTASPLSALSALLGTSSTDNSLSSLSALLGNSSSSTGLSDSAGLNSGLENYTAKDYISLLQLLIAQMQTNATQTMSSDLTDVMSSDSGSYGLL